MFLGKIFLGGIFLAIKEMSPNSCQSILEVNIDTVEE